jgi:Flp pilus assembly protein TadG
MKSAYVHSEGGSSAVEFALVISIFALAIPSVVDVGVFAYNTMQVRNSAQMGAQALWAACTKLPVTDSTACPTAKTAVTEAVRRTSLGSLVSVADANVVESYRCTNASGVLQNAVKNSGNTYTDDNTNTGTLASGSSLSTRVPSPPTTCPDPTNSKTTVPGNYVYVTVTYAYTPVFPRVSVANLLPSTISGRAWMRLL